MSVPVAYALSCSPLYYNKPYNEMSGEHYLLVRTLFPSILLLQLGFASAFPQDEKTQTQPAITEALERVYHYTKFGVYYGCVVVVGFPATAMWAIFAALFSFSFTWFMLPCVNILSVGIKMCLPLLHLPMKILTDVISPFLDKILQYVRQCRGRNC